MNRKIPKLKALLIGFVLTKVVVTVVYLAGTLPLSDLLFTRTTAVAQVSTPEETTAADADTETPEAGREAQYAEVLALMNQLEIKRLKLQEEAASIKQERTQLEALKLDIDQKLDDLAAAQTKLDETLALQAEREAQAQAAKSAAETAKIKQLVKVYTSMSPKKAAEIIEKLDMKVVYEVFSNMKGEQMGQILTYVSGERAAAITERLAAESFGE
jgi:flagellar motility protein MotE (MotC chaperone)